MIINRTKAFAWHPATRCFVHPSKVLFTNHNKLMLNKYKNVAAVSFLRVSISTVDEPQKLIN